MNNKKILSRFGWFLLVAGLIIFVQSRGESKTSAAGKGSASPLVVSETHFDFGKVSMASGKVAHTFVIENPTEHARVLSKLFTSCMCTEATLSVGEVRKGPFGMLGHGFHPSLKESIPSRGTAELEVVFDPAAHGPAGIGPITRTVTLEDDAGKKVEVTFSAVVTP